MDFSPKDWIECEKTLSSFEGSVVTKRKKDRKKDRIEFYRQTTFLGRHIQTYISKKDAEQAQHERLAKKEVKEKLRYMKAQVKALSKAERRAFREEVKVLKQLKLTDVPKQIGDKEPPQDIAHDGTHLHSKNEVILLMLMHYFGIFPENDYELQIGSGTYPYYVDFVFSQNGKRYYWEHLGLLEDPTYAAKTRRKLFSYEQIGIEPGKNLILTTDGRNINVPRILERMIEAKIVTAHEVLKLLDRIRKGKYLANLKQKYQ